MTRETEKKKRHRAKKKRYWIPVTIIVLLVVGRLLLPYFVKNYVNKTLANIPGYYGQVADIDISLIRGAYVIEGMYLNTVNADTQVPFLDFPKTDISVEWKSLFKGKIVSEIIMQSPTITYIFQDMQEEAPGGDADIEDWTAALTDLVPLEINHFEVHDGKLGFVQLQAEPQIDLYMDKVELTADNLRNVVEKERSLPSPITATGISIGQGKFELEGAMNIIKEVPDMNIDFSLQNADVTALNELTRHYGGIDFKKGKAEVFGEIAIADGYMKGYVKPLLSDSELISKEDGILGVIWEGFVGMFKFVLKNQGTDTFATKIPLEGDLNGVEAGIWPTVTNIFKNAWVSAFKGEVDEDIDFQDATQEVDLSKMSGKERRAYKKEQRQERREERRKEKKLEEDEDTDEDKSDDGWFGGSDDS